MAATLQPDVPDLDAGPDRLGQPDEGGVHVGGGQGDRLYHNGGMFTQRCESYGEAGDRHGAAGRPFCTAAVQATRRACRPRTGTPVVSHIPSRCRSNGRRLHGELQRRQERGEQHASGVRGASTRSSSSSPHIPEKMPMDSELGFFGAYPLKATRSSALQDRQERQPCGGHHQQQRA
jgi:hypothetical protein